MTLQRDGLTDLGQGPGVTPHFVIQYETNLYAGTAPAQAAAMQARIVDNANALLSVVEREYVATTRWFNTPPGMFDGADRQVVNLEQDDGSGALNNGYRHAIRLAAEGQAAGLLMAADMTAERVRMLFIAEWVEVLMNLTGHWRANDSSGEALSQWCTIERFRTGHYSYYTASWVDAWLNATPRENWVSSTYPGGTKKDSKGKVLDGDGDPVSFGCGLAFLYYLVTQLGFGIDEVIAAGAADLATTYLTLTKDPVDPFPTFLGLMEAAYPSSTPATVRGPDIDDPFPLPSGRSLSAYRYIAALPPGQRYISVAALISGSGHRSLRAALNSRRTAALV